MIYIASTYDAVMIKEVVSKGKLYLSNLVILNGFITFHVSYGSAIQSNDLFNLLGISNTIEYTKLPIIIDNPRPRLNLNFNEAFIYLDLYNFNVFCDEIQIWILMNLD